MKYNYAMLSLILFIGIMLSGCGNKTIEESNGNSNNTNRLIIYTTLFPLEDFAKKIGGDHVTVHSIIPPGVDTHSFEPSTKTMIKIADADAYIFSNQEMESFAGGIADALKNENVKILEASNGIELIEHNHDDHVVKENEKAADHDNSVHGEDEADHGHKHGDKDPHVWIDPILAGKLADTIKSTLIELKPEAQDEFEANFQALNEQLLKLDDKFHRMVDQKKDPKILVSHAAYGYWEKSYGIIQISLTGLSPTDEPSQQQLKEIIKTAKENKISYVIFEQNITPKVAEIVKGELQAEALYLHNLEVLTDKDIKNNEDYFSIMEKNIKTLDQAMD